MFICYSLKKILDFFENLISVSLIIELFLNNVRLSLQVFAISLKKRHTDWNAFILAIQELGYEKQHNEDLFAKKKGIVASVLDTEDNGFSQDPQGWLCQWKAR